MISFAYSWFAWKKYQSLQGKRASTHMDITQLIHTTIKQRDILQPGSSCKQIQVHVQKEKYKMWPTEVDTF